ncbi:MAG: 4-(cytidine 5'-diphospho)-2-C-methyl-D-erythritol kinase [Dysgonomonas sp.]
MITFPNAKINLGLNIVSKRDDGYHNLETIFYPIAIKDAVEVIISEDGKDSLTESGITVDTLPENNLVMKAVQAMRKHYNIPPISIHLLKKIPFGAGIGGGSADASFMLKLLNEKFNLRASKQELASIACQLGADCPFFIYNKPLFASGIGEIFENVDIDLKKYYFVLVKPNIHVSTKEAFAMVKPRQPQLSLKEIITKDLDQWKHLMHNDFEDSIFPQYPEIESIKHQLYNLGAIYSSMSGSGSSVYGIFEKEADLENQFPTDYYIWQGEGM